MIVTVAIPVLNGGETFVRVLEAVCGQRVDSETEILVCDSGSRDGSAQRAREYGARVIEIAREEFGHGRTRNLLLREARGTRVALLSQDAQPADQDWLSGLLAGFEEAADVGLVYGAHLARPDASASVQRELRRWFDSLRPGAERLENAERELPALDLMGRRGFFSDSNACVAREAWQRVPFRDIDYAEDRALALDMLRAGYAKVYVPAAAVWHSHEYSPTERFRRAFDEWRGLRDVYGWREPLGPRRLLLSLRGEFGPLRRDGASGAELVAAAGNEFIRYAGAVLGSRAAGLPASVERRLSLERRSTMRRGA